MYVHTYVLKFGLHVLSISAGKSGSAKAHNAAAVGKQFISFMEDMQGKNMLSYFDTVI